MVKKLMLIIGALTVQCIIVSTTMCEENNSSVNLEKPPIRSVTDSGFPTDEAGMAAYVNLGTLTGIQMNTVLKVFESLIESNSVYTLGIVHTDLNIHLYVGFSGWIIAYIPIDTPVGSVIYHYYSSSKLRFKNVFYEEIQAVYSALKKSYSSTYVKFFHFKYPEAKHLMSIYEKTGSSNSFYIELPGEYTFYEASYRLKQGDGILKVDDNEVAKTSTTAPIFGQLDFEHTLIPEVSHKITIENTAASGTLECNTIIIYDKNL